MHWICLFFISKYLRYGAKEMWLLLRRQWVKAHLKTFAFVPALLWFHTHFSCRLHGYFPDTGEIMQSRGHPDRSEVFLRIMAKTKPKQLNQSTGRDETPQIQDSMQVLPKRVLQDGQTMSIPTLTGTPDGGVTKNTERTRKRYPERGQQTMEPQTLH